MYANLVTPSVLVDLDVAEANIVRYQSYCDGHNLTLRPHIKTHKLPLLAKAQLDAGAVGITCQKISEAEAMISQGGIEDVFITYNIMGDDKLNCLRSLSQKVRLSVVADSEMVINGLAEAFADAQTPLAVLVECDTGARRCGVQQPEQAMALAVRIDAASGLKFGGLMTYPPAGATDAVQSWLSRAKALIEAGGIAVPVVSGGGSPDMWNAHLVPVVTEYRVGTYIYNDRSLVARGTCSLDDCALSVLATIVSMPTVNRAIIDAGSKVLTSDLLGFEDFGAVLGHPDIRIDQLSEEHGRMVSEQPLDLRVGDRVRIVPNHACVVSNMLDHVQLIRGSQLVAQSPVLARGKVW
ncbi:D-TA family PLP-dependent enzyme [Cohaesibacter celericrescens]|uniref:Alanine racemase n=1 Tax=Cohaesibacter celericrescens TaxID=2067669 RepID=A0A2N5XXH5_9HYPH|nr:D-TA family PLP-dependent enzyme [Cohaesibacter celericrescens]PLW79190.1 alanine racemase [Cohaesibacter celericrescens]